MALSKITARDNDFEESIGMHFTRGASELASVASCLLRAQEDPSVHVRVREHIEEACQEFSRAGDLAQQKLERVDSATLKVMDLKKKLTDEQKELSEHLSTLQNHLRSLETLQRENQVNCEGERDKKEVAQKKQKVATGIAETHRTTRNVAFGTMLIPIVGTVIGGIVAIGAHRAMKDAEKSAALAEEMADKCTRKEQEYHEEAEKYAKLIERQEESILENQRRIKTIAEEQHVLSRLHKEVLDLQEALRQCSHFVGTLASKVSAAEITSRYICIYDVLRDQMNDMSNHMLPLLGVKSIGAEGLKILSRPDVKRTIWKLKRFSQQENIFQNIYYDIMDHVPYYEEMFSWHFALSVLAFLSVLAGFLSAIRLSWFFIICFILFTIFQYFIQNSK